MPWQNNSLCNWEKSIYIGALTNYLLIIGSGLEITEKCALPKARAANVTQQVLFTFFVT
jgi:hypothetical protein